MSKELPKDWRWVKLGEVCGIVYGKGLLTKNLSKKGFPVFGANGIIGYNDKYLFEEPMVLISCRGAYSGKINFSPPKCYVTNNSLVLDVRSKGELDKNYLFYSLIAAKKNKLVTGTAQPQVTINNAIELDIPLPPKPIQQAIVSKIEELFSEIEKGIESLFTAQQQLKTYRQSVLKWAFEGRLTNENVKDGELPKGWIEKEIKDVCQNIKVGIVIKPSNFYSQNRNGIKAFRSANVREYQINDSDWVYFTEESNEINYRTKLKEGDVLLVRSGYPGTSCVVSKRFEGANAIDILIATPNKEKMLPDYLCCFNNSPLGKGIFTSKSRGVAQKHLNVGEYSKLKINFPSIKEQHLIVQEIESRLSVADKMEEGINQSLQQAEALKQSILKKAFEGKL
jgi:type I restriction enzyme S subunit